MSVEEALAAYRAHPGVVYAEPDYRVYATLLPDDPQFSDLWGLNNTGQTGGTPGIDIDAPEVWDTTTGSGNTIVAVIDTGVEYDHDDLADNMWINTAEANGTANVDDDGNGYVDDVYGYDFYNDDPDPRDDNQHGTHVAGTIGAVGNNDTGITGVNWDVQIMALKFLGADGSGTTSDAIDAINYAVANGATISNNSWGDNEEFSQVLYDTIAAARDADHVFMAAAGNGFFGFPLNNDSIPFYPASFDLDNIISVAATDHNNNLASFSNYGATTVDLAAPGVDILSTVLNDQYGQLSGTSMATPHVTGVVALVRDMFPAWTYGEVISHVLDSVVQNPAIQGVTVTGGQLNAANVLPSQSAEIRVLAGAQDIVDGVGNVDFGTTLIGMPVTKIFTVRNTGLEDLTLGSQITVPTGFVLTKSFDTTTLTFQESTTFEVQLDASTVGTPSGEISFTNNDSNENPFNFSVSGTVTTVAVIDDGDAQYSTSGAWSNSASGFQVDHQWSALGSGSDVARWTFAVSPGQYEVAATWGAATNRATNSPFTVEDGGSALSTVALNQELAPDDVTDQGVGWEILGTFTITSGTLTVELSDAANEYVIADGVRIDRVGEVPTGPEIQVTVDGADLADDVGNVDFGSTTEGSPITKTFAVTNVGATALTLVEPIGVPTGFSLASSFAVTTLAPGGGQRHLRSSMTLYRQELLRGRSHLSTTTQMKIRSTFR